MMRQPLPLKSLTCVIAGLTFCAIAQTQSVLAADQPNVLFIFSDDHALQAIGAYGSRINETPNIDRLARQGAVFENSFCANSICGPSRACILTGRHSHVNGFLRNGNRFNATQMTFPRLLQGVGYETALVGKWHLGTNPVGFDYWEVLPGQGSYYNPDFIQMDGSRKRYTGYCTDIITQQAMKWLGEERDTDKPFFLMCQHKAPHRNWAPHPRHFSMFPSDVAEPDTLFDDYEGRSELLKENEMSIRDHFHWGHDMKFKDPNPFPEFFAGKHGNGEYQRMNEQQRRDWDAHYEPENQEFIRQMNAGELSDDDIVRWKYQRYIKDYLRCIAAVDDGIGELLDYLDESGLADNTIVIYSSDQGFYLGEHGWYDKRWMYEESFRTPLMIRWPGKIEPGSVNDDMVMNLDFAQTFLEAAGEPDPEEMQGESFLPILQGQTPDDWRTSVYYHYYEFPGAHSVRRHYGVRDERYKLIHYYHVGEWELFDLNKDPQEMRSVYAEAAYEPVKARMLAELNRLREYYGDDNTIRGKVDPPPKKKQNR